MALPPPVTLAEAHIQLQARLQALATQAVANAWTGLAAYNAANVAQFLGIVVPLILAAQRQSAALTNAYVGQAIGRPPLPLDVAKVIGPAIRAGTPTAKVYERPFVTVWTALKNQAPYVEAVHAGQVHAQASAAMDVQNTMRHTLRAIGEADKTILGYRRVPNADACELCKLVAGRRYLTGVLMEIHVHCKCGVEVITAANRGDFFGKDDNDLAVAPGDEDIEIIKHPNTPIPVIALHGELGPLIVDGRHHFTSGDEIAA